MIRGHGESDSIDVAKKKNDILKFETFGEIQLALNSQQVKSLFFLCEWIDNIM